MSSRPGPTPCRARQSQLLCAATVWIRFNLGKQQRRRINSWQPHTYTTRSSSRGEQSSCSPSWVFTSSSPGRWPPGLARRAIELVAPPLQTTVVEETVKRDEPPPPPPPQMERPPVEVPPPDVNIELPAEPTSTAIVDTTDKPVVKAPPPPAPTAPSGRQKSQAVRVRTSRLPTITIRRHRRASGNRARRQCTCALTRRAS